MIFSEEYDRALWLALVGDEKNREEIARLVSSIPAEIYQQIYQELGSYFEILESDLGKSLNFKKTLCSNGGINYFFNIEIGTEELNIRLCKWEGFPEYLEENFELTLVPITRSDLAEIKSISPTYVGSYSYENSRLNPILGRSLVISFDCERQYNIKRTPIGVVMYRKEDSCFFKKIDLSKMPYDITLNDLNNKRNLNRLVRGRKRY